MIEIRKIDRSRQADVRLKNEAFAMPGRLIPGLRDGVWTWRAEMYPVPKEMTFPDEDYDLAELEKNGAVFGAYDGEKCVGLAIYQRPLFKYLYLYDLKVSKAYRGRGIGKMLVKAGLQEARERGCLGVYTQGQDNNLNACLFYLKAGFRIGGFDNRLYEGTSQAGKGDVIFYAEA